MLWHHGTRRTREATKQLASTIAIVQRTPPIKFIGIVFGHHEALAKVLAIGPSLVCHSHSGTVRMLRSTTPTSAIVHAYPFVTQGKS